MIPVMDKPHWPAWSAVVLLCSVPCWRACDIVSCFVLCIDSGLAISNLALTLKMGAYTNFTVEKSTFVLRWRD